MIPLHISLFLVIDPNKTVCPDNNRPLEQKVYEKPRFFAKMKLNIIQTNKIG